MYTIQNLRAFVAVCQCGSVTGAADLIRRTQPQVSRLVSELEADLGFSLFVREGRRLTPTPRSVRFFEDARRTLTAFDDIGRVAKELRSERHAPIRVLAPPHAAHSVIPATIAKLRQQHPDLRVQLEILSRNSIGAWSAYGPFDIGIAALPFDLPWIRKEPLARTKMVALVPRKHPLADARRITAEDTEKYPFVALHQSTPTRKKMDEAFKRARIKPDIVCETQTVLSAYQMVAHGIGITAVDPLLMTAASVMDVKTIEWEIPIYLEYCLFRPTSKSTSEMGEKFATALHRLVAEIEKSSRFFIKATRRT
jgi:DNA-binding transcriptional LysR family regulator